MTFRKIWGGLAVLSMLGYGFTGVGMWTPLGSTGVDAVFRFMVLFMFHVGGVIALITLVEPESR